MKTFWNRWNPFQHRNAEFNRYYAGVIGSGEGCPTADEARKDLRSLNRRWEYSHLMR